MAVKYVGIFIVAGESSSVL